MKIKNILLIAAVVIVAACSKDLLDVTFDANYKVDLPVAVTAAKGETYSFSVSDSIKPGSDAEVAKYLDRIKSWEMTGIDGKFKDLSENFKLISGTLKVSAGTESAEWTFANIDVVEAYNMVLNNDNGQFDYINNLLSSKKDFKVELSGVTDKKDINYNVELNLKTQVTANPLD